VQVVRYPTLVLFYDNERVGEYSGQRELDSLQQFVLDARARHDEL